MMDDLSDGNYIVCWSCTRKIRVGDVRDCDGFCPHCDSEIDLDLADEVES